MRRILTESMAFRGERVPRWYGVAYYDLDYNAAIYYPLGMHLLVGFSRKLYHWFLSIRMKSVIDEAYERGLDDSYKKYTEGYKDGYRECMRTFSEGKIDKPSARSLGVDE